MRRLARILDRFSHRLNQIALAGAVLAVLVMAFSALWQVIARYALDSPPVWTEELARRAMVWAGMLGASAAFRFRADPTLVPSALQVRGAAGVALTLVRSTGVVLFALPVIWYCLFGANMNLARGFMARSLERQAEMLNVAMIWFTAAVPLAFALILLHVAADIAMQVSGQATSAAIDPEEPRT